MSEFMLPHTFCSKHLSQIFRTRKDCVPCKSTCEMPTLASHWTSITVWLTLCTEYLNQRKINLMLKLSLFKFILPRVRILLHIPVTIDWIIYLSKCNHLVVQLIPVVRQISVHKCLPECKQVSDDLKEIQMSLMLT